MLEYYEVNPLPQVCVECMKAAAPEEDCYNCDNALERWKLTQDSEEHLQELIDKQKQRRKKHTYR